MTIFRTIFCGVFCALVSLHAWADGAFGSGSSFGQSKSSGGFSGASLGASESIKNMQQIATDAQVTAMAATSGLDENTARAVVNTQNLSIDTSGSQLLGDSVSTKVTGDSMSGGSSDGMQAEQTQTSGNSESPKPQNNQQSIDEAQKAYSNAKANEQSLANRLLGGATMAATGIGGMQLAQGLAEQNADKKAEQDMAAYLATFQCKIGDNGGRSYSGGEMGIEVGGTNQLTGLYQQYVDLAADLRERKNALGMAPGIESQVVMDKANMGLYDAEGGKGIENGTYASLYRASRGNETDVNKLAEQSNTSQTRVKAGAIAAGAGIVGGIVGNGVINSGDGDTNDKDNSKSTGNSDKKNVSQSDKNSSVSNNSKETGDKKKQLKEKAYTVVETTETLYNKAAPYVKPVAKVAAAAALTAATEGGAAAVAPVAGSLAVDVGDAATKVGFEVTKKALSK